MSRQLSPRHEALVERIVASGEYADADQAIGAALRLLDDRLQGVRELRAKLQVGLDQLDRGEGEEWSPLLMARLSREADEMFRRGEQPDPDVCP